MSTQSPVSMVSVYSASNSFEADVVRAMLADDEIQSTVENANAPFPTSSSSPCTIFVTAEDEPMARQLIALHEAHHRQRIAEEEGLLSQESAGDLIDSFDDDTVEFDAVKEHEFDVPKK